MRLQLWSLRQSSTIPQITIPTQALQQRTLKDPSSQTLDIHRSLSRIIQHKQTRDTHRNPIPGTHRNPIPGTQRNPIRDTHPTLTLDTHHNQTHDTQRLLIRGIQVTLSG